MKRAKPTGTEGPTSGVDDILFAEPQAAASQDNAWALPAGSPSSELSSVLRGVKEFDLQPDGMARPAEPNPSHPASRPAIGAARTGSMPGMPMAGAASGPGLPRSPIAATPPRPKAPAPAPTPRVPTPNSAQRLQVLRRRRLLAWTIPSGFLFGLGASTYVWLGIGSVPLAAVVAALSTVGSLLAWVLLRR